MTGLWSLPDLPGLDAEHSLANQEELGYLERAIQRVDDFALLVVEVPHAGLGVWVRDRLKALPGRVLLDLPLDSPELARLLLDGAPAGEAHKPLWLVRERGVLPPELSRTLADLNLRRNTLVRALPGPLIYCASQEGVKILAQSASDLWSVRSESFRLEPEPLTTRQLNTVRVSSQAPQLMLASDPPPQMPAERLEALAEGEEASGHREEAIRLWMRAGLAHLGGNPLGGSPTAQRAAEQAYKRAAQLAEVAHLSGALGEALSVLGDHHFVTGRTEEAEAEFLEALGCYRSLGHLQREAHTLLSLGSCYLLTGRLGEAEDAAVRARSLFQQTADADGEAQALSALGDVYQRAERPSEAEAAYEQALTCYQSHEPQNEHRPGEAHKLLSLGGLYLKMGRLKEAGRVLEQSVALYRRNQARAGEVLGLLSLGDIARKEGSTSLAVRRFCDALSIAQAVQSDLLIVRCHFALAETAQSLGSFQAAAVLAGRVLALEAEGRSSLQWGATCALLVCVFISLKHPNVPAALFLFWYYARQDAPARASELEPIVRQLFPVEALAQPDETAKVMRTQLEQALRVLETDFQQRGVDPLDFLPPSTADLA